MLRVLKAICFCVALSVNAFGEEFRLFTEDPPHLPVENYSEVLMKIRVQGKPGDKIHLGGGRSYEFGRLLGSGTTTVVIDVGDRKALRLAASREDLMFIYHTIDGEKNFFAVEIPRVNIHSESVRGRFVVVDSVPSYFTLEEFLYNQKESVRQLSVDQRTHATIQAIEFAKKTASYRHISDFGPRQVIWTGETWLLVDWSNSHASVLASSTDTEHALIQHNLPRDLAAHPLVQQMTEAAIAQRTGATRRTPSNTPLSKLTRNPSNATNPCDLRRILWPVLVPMATVPFLNSEIESTGH
jgi:hypothetical protein